MKKAITLILFLLSTFIIPSCGVHKAKGEYTYGTMRIDHMVLNSRQLDSICTIDSLPRDLKEWQAFYFYDYETGDRIEKRLYIKEFAGGRETTYIISTRDTLYEITKRLVQE